MKNRKWLIYLLSFLLLLFFSSVGLAISKILYREEYPVGNLPDPIDLAEKAVHSEDKLNIPMYTESDLLYVNGVFYLGIDESMYDNLDSRPNSYQAMLAHYPTDAIRMRDDGKAYLVYDCDAGCRLYLFLSEAAQTVCGFPVIIGSVHSSADFSALSVGDSIDEVEKIDGVITQYKKFLLDVAEVDQITADSLAETGYPVTSVHYLSDGILKIEYGMDDSGTLYITNIEHSDDFTLINPVGQTIDYTILDIDLPK